MAAPSCPANSLLPPVRNLVSPSCPVPQQTPTTKAPYGFTQGDDDRCNHGAAHCFAVFQCLPGAAGTGTLSELNELMPSNVASNVSPMVIKGVRQPWGYNLSPVSANTGYIPVRQDRGDCRCGRWKPIWRKPSNMAKCYRFGSKNEPESRFHSRPSNVG